MKKLNSGAAAKLQEILTKRLGRSLTSYELEQAYASLMGFAEALLDLSSFELPTEDPPQHLKSILNEQYSQSKDLGNKL